MSIDMENRLNELMEKAGVTKYDCYQCGKCSGGCPMARSMDLGPRGVMRCVQTGSLKQILESDTIWLCSGCYACVDRCPHDVNVPAFIEEARYEAMRLGIQRRDSEVLNKVFVNNLKMFGRSHEMILAGAYNVLALKPLQDVAYLPHMMENKMLDIMPNTIDGNDEMAEIIERAENWGKE